MLLLYQKRNFPLNTSTPGFVEMLVLSGCRKSCTTSTVSNKYTTSIRSFFSSMVRFLLFVSNPDIVVASHLNKEEIPLLLESDHYVTKVFSVVVGCLGGFFVFNRIFRARVTGLFRQELF